MADIRKSGPIPYDFTSPEKNPVDMPPWANVGSAEDMQIWSNSMTGTEFPPTPSFAQWNQIQWSGRAGEVWGKGHGAPATTAGWRLALFQVPCTPGNDLYGYSVLPHNNVGPDTWLVRRYDGPAGFTNIANPEWGLITNLYCILRLNGSYVEGWRSLTSDPNGSWEQVFSLEDATYSGPFVPCFGTTGTECGWSSGGGTPYGGFTPQIIRRQHLRGDIPRSRPT